MLTIGRHSSNIYWIFLRRAPEHAAVRAAALMDLIGFGVMFTWVLPEEKIRQGGDELQPPDAAETPLLRRFLGLHNPNCVFKRPVRLGWWTWSRVKWPEQWREASTGAAMRALAWLPLSDRVSQALTGWALRRSARAWALGFPVLAGGVAVCLGAQMVAVVLCAALYLVVALFLGIGTFGFYSDKKIALR